jgi:hypothetical protein
LYRWIACVNSYFRWGRMQESLHPERRTINHTFIEKCINSSPLNDLQKAKRNACKSRYVCSAKMCMPGEIVRQPQRAPTHTVCAQARCNCRVEVENTYAMKFTYRQIVGWKSSNMLRISIRGQHRLPDFSAYLHPDHLRFTDLTLTPAFSETFSYAV